MSVHVSSWAWKQKLGDPGLKLVLVKLADNADDEGYSWWRQKRLAEECEMSRATVQRKLKALAERGFVDVEVRSEGPSGARVANGYRVLWPGYPPPQSEAGSPHGSDATPRLIAVRQQEPSVEPSGHSSPPPAWNGPKTVGGKAVTRDEVVNATAALDTFNEVSGRRFSGKEWLTMIVRRMREHPDVPLERHQEIIRDQFARPWWKGDPSPSVIYGKGSVFDRALNGVGRSRKRERVYTQA